MAKLDRLPASVDGTASAIGEIHGASRNLGGQSQRIRRLPAGTLKPAAGLAGKSSSNLIRIGWNGAKDRGEPGVVIEAAPKPPDDAL